MARQFSGTTPGGLALVWSFIFADMAAGDGVTPEMRAMRSELDSEYSNNRDVRKLLAIEGRMATLRMDGIAGFDGTDLAGGRWNASSFAGRVTVIDFWATWCGPCVGEIPTLRKAWEEFQPRGLQMVGVSLDMDDRKSFEAWLKANNVAWPQIWDGRGFSTPLARKFRIFGIPCSVLIDPNGRVVDVDLRGEALIARSRQLVEASPATGGQ